MGTASEIQRLTIARFDRPRALRVALEAIDDMGMASTSLSVAGIEDALERTGQDLGVDARDGGRFAVLFQYPVPVIELQDGCIAYSGRDSLLARYKSGASRSGQGSRADICPLSKSHQQEMAERLQAGLVFLIAGAADIEQYIRCQSLLLRHSTGRVLGLQFSWQADSDRGRGR